jgi:hypothetical protein
VGLLFVPIEPIAAALLGQLVGPTAVLGINALGLRAALHADGGAAQPVPQAVSR